MAFDPTSAFLDDDTQPAAKGAFDPSTAAFDASTATEDFEADQGVLGTLKEGTKSAARAIGSTANTYTGNADGVVEKAKAQQEAPKDYRLDNFYRDVEENTKASGEDPGLLDAIGNVGKAVWDNPAGAGLAVLEQLPNSVPTLAGGYAGMKGGAALGAVAGGPVGAGIGGVVGGLAGMFLGNAAIETGHKAMGAADDGEFTPEEMDQVKREGAIKGGVITAVDAVTLGLGGAVSGAMQRTTRSALEAATRKALVDQGVDVADEAAVLAARSNPQVSAAVRAAQESAVKASDTLKRRAAEAGTLLSMESVGEGLGEYLGELAATGEGNVTDAVLESLLSLGQSGAETAWNMTRKREQRGLWEEAAAIADPSLDLSTPPAPGIDPALDGSAPIDAAAPEAAPAVDTSMVQPTPTAENPEPVPVPRPDPNHGPLSAAASLLPPAGAPALSAGPLSDVAPATEQAAEPVAEQQAPAQTEGPLAEAPPVDPQASTEPPATPSQRAILARRGVGPEQIEGLTRKQAGELIQQQNKTQTAGAPKPQQMPLQEPGAVEAELRDQLSYLERQAKSAGGWTPALSRERARLRTALEPFDQNPSAAPAAVDAPADAFKVGEQWQKGRTSYTIESVSPDGRLADAVFPGGKRHKVSLDAELANGWQRSGQQAGAAVEQAIEPAVEADPIQGQDIDGDWMTFAEQSGTKQVPRAQMPQIKAEHRGAMVNFLNARGIEHQEETVAAASLKPTQGEFSRKKVEQAKAYTGGNRSILVSSDNHVLDGHHQWLAARESGDEVKIIRLGAPIDQLLTAAHEFPSSTTDAAAPAANERRYQLVAINEKTGRREVLSAEPMTHAEAVTVKGKHSDYPGRRIQLEEVSASAADQMPVKDAAPAAPDAQPAEAAPVKWFASESKAQAHIAKKKLGGTHQVVKNGNKYEIHPLAEQQGDLIVQQPPAVGPTSAASPSVEQGEVAAKAPIEIPEKAFADLLAEMEQGEDAIPVFVEPAKTVRSEDRAKGDGEMTVEQAQALVAEWEAHAKAQGKSRVNAGKVVLSLFDTSGEWSQPWLDAGYEVHRFDIQDGMDINDFSVEYLTEQLGIERADIILAAPPCTDFSSSGAHAWKKKDADGRTAASVELVRQTLRTVELFRPSSWALENPVGRIQKLTGLPKPAMTFQPNNFGDPYTKRTLLWGDFNTELPLANVAPTEGSKITNGLAGKDKYGRSLTPKGFAYAYFMANNLADMSAADRLAAEFKGFPRAEFQAATDAGMTEAAIRSTIEDSYNDQDIEAAREDLRNAMPTPPAPTRKAPEPVANGSTFGELFHGTARQFDLFDGTRLGKNGGGYNHQGRGVYLTDDRDGYARFFADKAAVKVSQTDKSLTEADADALFHSGGTIARVKLADDAKLLDLRNPGTGQDIQDIQDLFARSVGDKAVGEQLRQRVLSLGYDGLVFVEPNAIEGWELKPDAITAVVYNEAKATITGAEPAASPAKPAKATPTKNVLVTDERAAELRKRLQAKLAQLNSGIDPEILAIGTELAVYHVERGARTFAAFAQNMAADLGVTIEKIRPYLRSWYNGARDMTEDMGGSIENMDGPDAVREALATLDNATTQEAPNGTDSTQPAVDRADQAGAPAPAGGRGRDSQSGSAQADTGRVAAGESEAVGEPVQGGADDAAGLRAPGTDVAGGERAAAPGRAADGRPRAGRKEPSDAGAGSAGRADRSPSVTATKAPAEVSPGNPGPGNFHVADPLKIVGGGQVARFDKNRAAIELYNELRAEGRPATREEQEVLAGYTGWGSFGQELFQGSWAHPAPKSGWEARDAWLRDNLGQKEWEGLQRSITNAHYTDPPTVLAMWEMVKRMGFQGGRVLEPSMGIGNFFGMMPADLKARSQLAGIELDPVTGGMAKLLYPDANVQVKGYQESKTPDGFYDLVIGNWPFEDTVIADRRYQRLNPYLHDYFFLKAVDQARAGGLVVGITSKGSMDKKSIGIRAELAKKAELVASFRLPSGAFKEYAGTSVVTDIVILRKRPEPVRNIADAGWIESVDYQTPSGETVSINEYYVKNPQNVIGTIDFGHGTTFKRPGMIVHRPDNMAEQLERITQLAPEGAFQPERQADTISYIANHTADRENSLTRTKDGLFVVRGEYLAPANEVAKYAVKSEATTRAREDQFDRLIELRKQYAAVIEAQRSGDAKAERKALKASYEAFVAKHGPINESYGLSYLQRLDDPFYASLAALEVIQKDGEATIYKPSAIMSRATTRGALTIESPSVADAYVLARNKNVNPTLEQVAELAKKPADEVKAELLAKGAVFELPAGDVVPADIYLSGNVREKLRDAKAAVAEGLAQLQRNVDALEKVVPADVPYYKIEAQMGASWVSTGTYGEYVAHMLNLPTADGIDVSYSGGRWKVKLPNGANNRAEASAGFGTKEVPFSRLVNAAIANQTINVKRRDSDGTEYVDGEATKEVNGKIAEIRQRFGEWLWSDPERRGQVEREYNDARNAYATPAFDGSVLAFEGMALSLGNGPFDLRQHQVNAIWRALVMRRSLNAHEVGTGKTFTMGGIAVESRRYGIAKKPLILAHNANSKSVAAEIQMMYPAAKVLYIDNLSPETVDIKLRQIANDDWDAVVLPHSLINRLAFKEETLMEMAYEEIRELEIAAAEAAEEDGVTLTSDMLKDEDELAKLRSVTAKDLVKTRNKIINTIQKQAQRASKEGATAFEDLGIDMVLVDEGHEFKKPPFTTKMKMKGLQTDSSDRSIALAFLTKYIRSNNNGGNVHVFTGTPITNTLTEVFHQMRYIMQEEMEAAGVDQWDGWFGSFAREVTDVELSASAEYEAVTRLSAFINVPELRRMIGQYMDVVFADDMPEMQPRRSATGKTMADDALTEAERAELLNGRTEQAKDRPYKKVIVDTTDLTEEQKVEFAKIQGYARAWRNMGGKERKQAMSAGDPESPIIYENLASKASFDVRLNRGAELAGQEGQVADDPNSKASRVVRNVLEVYNSHPLATQVIFAQQGLSTTATRSVGPAGNKKKITYKTFSTMRDVVERLVQQGIPREQIAIVDGSTSKDKRKAIADAMNRAEIRVVIGSTQSLGVGVNMQRNLRAMHHMDAPWMPGDLEQRNGRGHRQGNQWNTVLEFRYLTDRLDGRRWQVLAIKQRFINAFLKSNDADRVIEGDAASDEESDILETFAEAAGDPRILVREKLKKKIEQLQSRERLHGQAVSDARRSLRITRERRDRQRDDLKALDDAGVVEAVKALTAATAGAGFTMTVDGTEYATRKEAEEAIAAFAEDNVRAGDKRAHPVGSFGGHALSLTWPQWADQPVITADINGTPISSRSLRLQSLETALRGYPDEIQKQRNEVVEAARTLTRLEQVANEPFHMAADLERVKKDYELLEQDLEQNPVPPPAWLRSGAPVDTEVTWKKKTFVVTGHRWNKDGWFVLAADAKGNVVIPYTEALDPQGLPIYEERTFEAPEVVTQDKPAGLTDADRVPADSDVRLSVGSRPTGATRVRFLDRRTVEQLAVEAVGESTARTRFVFTSYADLPEDVKAEAARQGASPRSVQGLYSPKHNKTFIIDDRFTSADEAKGIMFHEHYVHFGLRAKYGLQLGPQLRKLLNGVGGMDGVRKLSREQGINLDAYERGILGNPEIDASKQPLILMEELLAHIGETTGSLRRLLEEFVGMLRAWARKANSKWFAELGVTDMAYVLREARNAAKRADAAPAGQPLFKLVGGVDQTVTDAFRSWFGASKVVDKQGEPQVLYHGTASEFTVFENRSGNSTGHATSDLGYFMTSDQRSAEGYARNASDGMPGLSRVMELYASIKNPYVATLEEMQAIENPLQARRWRAKLEQAGHDGMHIPAAKAWVAFNNYQIKSATDNVGTFDEFDADIRFRLGDFIGRRESFDVAASTAKRMLKGRIADLKPAMLGALPLNYLRDFAPQSMTALTAYMDEKRAMDADRNEMHTRYDAIAQRWLKLRWTDRKAEQRLADLMHAATLEGVDPSKPIKEAYTPEQKAAYNRLRMQFQSLPAEHRAMFGEARDAYKQQISTLEGVIEENIRKSAEYAKKRARRDRDADIQRAKDELVGDELDEALEAAEKRYNGRVASAEKGGSAKILLLRQKFESMRVDEPYFPLKRYGDYFVAMRDGDELVSFSMFESAADMEAAAAELRKTYPNLSVKVGRQSNKQELEGAVDPAFIADLQDVVSRMPNSKELSDQIYQMYLETMPDFSMRKGFIHRKKTAGFDRDAMRAFASSMFHSSYQIARLKHSLEMNELVEQAEDQAKAAKDPVDAMTIANELRKRHEWVMSPKSGKIAQHITSAAFVYQLGITPAAALVNTTQTFMMGIPILGARFGSETKATAALAKASADFVQGRGHIEKRLEGQEAAAFAEFMRMGLIDKTQAHDLAGVGETGVEYNPVRHKVMGYISWAFHNAERYNREVTVMAAYRLGRANGLEHEAAIKEAAELTWTTHFDYSSGNRARFMQNDTAKVLLVFRQHSINMLSRLVIDLRGAMKGETPEVKRLAKRRLAGMFSMFGLFSGVMGIPGVMAILALLDLFDDDDDPWSTEDKMKRNLVDALGPDVAAAVLGGLPGTMADLSLTERIGMGYLWFRPAGRELEGKDAYLYWMEQVLGAAPAMVSNTFTGVKMIGEGHVWRGIEAMMPKAIKDAMRAGRYTQEGVLTMDGTPLVDEVGTWNVIAQAMGFTPAHIAERYDMNRALKNAEQHILTERRSILNRYAMAVKQGDTEMRGKLLERIQSFNKRYPQYPITGKTITQSLKARLQRQAGAEGGIVLNRRLEFLRDQL